MEEKKKIFSESDFDKDKQIFTPEDFEEVKDAPKVPNSPPIPNGGEGNGSNNTDKSKTVKIVGGIAAAAAILAGVYFFGMKDDNKDIDDGVNPPTEQVAQAGETTQPETTSQTNTPEDVTAAEGESVNNDSEGTGTTNANETPATTGNENASVPTNSNNNQSNNPSTNANTSAQPVQPAQSKQSNATTTKIAVTSAPIGEDVVENAKRVIRGDFGNGQERKDKLGSAYNEIQSKVNEMYRQGLVY